MTNVKPRNLLVARYLQVNYGRGTERRKDVEGGEEVGSGQKTLEKLRGSPLLLQMRQ
jgi:hypothetical protein